MRVAYVSVATPLLRRSWSGIPWYSLKAIERRFSDVHVVDTPLLDRMVEKLAAVEHVSVAIRRNPLVSRLYRNSINAALEEIQPDVVVGVAAAHKLAFVDPKWPIVYASDALFGTVVNYYTKYRIYNRRTKARGEEVQRSLLSHTDRILLASEWAQQDAMRRYGLSEEVVGVAPMGANIDAVPEFTPAPQTGPLRLIFVGYAWERKGGPLVLDILRELDRRTGGNVELHIIGSRPKAALGLHNVVVHGMIDKNDPVSYQRFVDLYQQAHFLMMPSRQEAYGIVYCESAAFGRPAVATVTGGVPTIVKDGETGMTLALDATPADYATRILETWSDRTGYDAMCRAARQDFEERLNWDCWSARIAEAIDALLATR